MSSPAEKLKAFRFEPYIRNKRQLTQNESRSWYNVNRVLDSFSRDEHAHKIAFQIGDLFTIYLSETLASIEKGELPRFIKDKVAERDANIVALDEATNQTIPTEILETIREFYPF